MKASSRNIPSSDNRIASTSMRANPSSGNSLEAKPIAHSIAVLRPPFGSLLYSNVAADVLPDIESASQAAGKCACGEMASLIDLREIFRAIGERHIPRDRAMQGEFQPGRTRRNPCDCGVCEPAS